MNSVWLRSFWSLAGVALAGLLAWALADAEWALAARLRGLAAAARAGTWSIWRRWPIGLRDPAAGPCRRAAASGRQPLAGLYRFVRARIKQEQQLSADLQRFRNAGLALPDGVVLLDAHGHIEWCNPTAEPVPRAGRAARSGSTPGQPGAPPDLAAYLEQSEYAEPLTAAPRAGEGRLLSLAIIPYGEWQKLLLASDITLAEKVETMRRDFVANVSHELKSPLTVVAGFLETLTTANSSWTRRPPGPRYLKLMREHTQRMQRLVEDLLTLSALEGSRGSGRRDAGQCSGAARRVRDEALALSAGRHRIELSVEEPLPARQPAGIAQRLRQPGQQRRALHACGRGHTRSSWGRRGAQAVFSVTDTGPGIEPRHIPRLTERFYRVDHSRSRETGGTGLGLAIVKHVLARHQATLEIDSEPGKGSSFSVFPARRIQGRPHPDSPGRQLPPELPLQFFCVRSWATIAPVAVSSARSRQAPCKRHSGWTRIIAAFARHRLE